MERLHGPSQCLALVLLLLAAKMSARLDAADEKTIGKQGDDDWLVTAHSRRTGPRPVAGSLFTATVSSAGPCIFASYDGEWTRKTKTISTASRLRAREIALGAINRFQLVDSGVEDGIVNTIAVRSGPGFVRIITCQEVDAWHGPAAEIFFTVKQAKDDVDRDEEAAEVRGRRQFIEGPIRKSEVSLSKSSGTDSNEEGTKDGFDIAIDFSRVYRGFPRTIRLDRSRRLVAVFPLSHTLLSSQQKNVNVVLDEAGYGAVFNAAARGIERFSFRKQVGRDGDAQESTSSSVKLKIADRAGYGIEIEDSQLESNKALRCDIDRILDLLAPHLNIRQP